MEGFLSDGPRLDALLVRYEDLVGERPPIDEIDAHLGIRMNRAVLGNKVGGLERRENIVRVSRLEKWLLKRAVSPVAGQLGYAW